MSAYYAIVDGDTITSVNRLDPLTEKTYRQMGFNLIPLDAAVDPDLHYVCDSQICRRPSMSTTLSGMTLLDVHPGSLITINGVSYLCEKGGDVELEFDHPGLYRVYVVLYPYLSQEFIIENPA